MSQTFFDTHTR